MFSGTSDPLRSLQVTQSASRTHVSACLKKSKLRIHPNQRTSTHQPLASASKVTTSATLVDPGVKKRLDHRISKEQRQEPRNKKTKSPCTWLRGTPTWLVGLANYFGIWQEWKLYDF